MEGKKNPRGVYPSSLADFCVLGGWSLPSKDTSKDILLQQPLPGSLLSLGGFSYPLRAGCSPLLAAVYHSSYELQLAAWCCKSLACHRPLPKTFFLELVSSPERPQSNPPHPQDTFI